MGPALKEERERERVFGGSRLRLRLRSKGARSRLFLFFQMPLLSFFFLQTHRFFSFATVSSGIMLIVYRFRKSSSGSVMSERREDEADSERE